MHDVIIIGAGPAGLSTAFWCDELGLDTLLLERASEVGGQLHSVFNPIKNYLGVEANNGKAFLELISSQLQNSDFDQWTETSIKSVDLRAKTISLESGEQLRALAIVIATGVRRRELGIEGEQEFVGKGIIDSGSRERDLFAGQDVCVIGGGDAAAENALLLAEVCPTVTLVHRGKRLHARREFVERLQPNHAITVFTESVVTRIIGDDHVALPGLRGNGQNAWFAFPSSTDREHASPGLFCFTEIDRSSPVVLVSKSWKARSRRHGRSTHAIRRSSFA